MSLSEPDFPGKRVQGRNCFLCGRENTRGLGIPFYFDGDVVRAAFVPGPHLCGFEGIVHGGIIFALADEAMMHLIWALGLQAVTAEAEIRYHNYARIDRRLRVDARMESQAPQLVKAVSVIVDDENRLIATVRGKFLTVASKDNEKFNKAF